MPPDGTPISNYAVKREIGEPISRDLYFSVRKNLIARGEFEAVQGGYGGRIARCKPTVPLENQGVEDCDWNIERNLYTPFHQYLRFQWPRQAGQLLTDEYLAEIVGDKRTDLDRPWSVPDLLAISCIGYKWTPAIELEVHSFELKTAVPGSEKDVYQAYAHAAFSHYSYFCLHTDNDFPPHKVDNALEVCRDLGVGFITFFDPKDLSSYRMLHLPNRNSPSLSAVDNVIELRFSAANRRVIRSWIKSRSEQWVR